MTGRARRRAGTILGGLAVTAALALAVPLGAVAAPADAPAPAVDRVAGADRTATAVAISKATYPATAPVVYVVTGTGYADALSAGPAAAVEGGPLLLTAGATLPQAVAEEITRLDPERIVVVGGPAAVGRAVISALVPLAPSVERVAGDTRFSTSLAVAEHAFGAGADTAYVATGRDFPDALTAGAAAGFHDAPVLLVDGQASALDTPTRDLMTRLGVQDAVVVGGPASVTPALEADLETVATTRRIGGDDRFATSAAVNLDGFASAERAFLVTGSDFPDALAGSAVAGSVGAPLYAVRTDCVPEQTLAALRQQGVDRVTLLGGPNALGAGVAALTGCGDFPQAPVRVPVGCDTVLPEATAEALAGGALDPVVRGGSDPLDFADARAGSLRCAFQGPDVPPGRYPASARLTIVPDVTDDDYAWTANGETFGGASSIPGGGPESKEFCRVGGTFPICGLIDHVDGYGLRLSVSPTSGAVTPELVAAARSAFAGAVAAVAAAGEPGPLWHPAGADLPGATDCDGLIPLGRVAEIVGDGTTHVYRSYEGEYALASFRSNRQVGGCGCAWSGETAPTVWASVLPGGAGYFRESTPVGGGGWTPTTGYPGEAFVSTAGDQVSILVDNAWVAVRVTPGQEALLPQLAAAVVDSVSGD
ncbi:cell wall-binding repeat-containing protein [Herbiconiux sp. CPCC 205716]|uniref:Cell wall-binding repeat-containing protein n=1 Tax=Herbiconiux gentiana TaxID=2970912 RepID=A0ABT2GHL8_9MICO|nr:cell wall-binding repeat-containing protein [Herbiconiux gentiana]MCS5715707.1 cell wall-binding repeat-containing protein [Herbiconiux gentiana]